MPLGPNSGGPTESVTMPFEGAVQVHHAVCPLETPVMKGSPVSLVAFEREPEITAPRKILVALTVGVFQPTTVKMLVTISVAIVVRFANLSLAGWAFAVIARPRIAQ